MLKKSAIPDELHHLSNPLQEESDEDSLMLEDSISHLPNEHPALSLPPVDVLLLVDASGSIGNVHFEHIKKYLRNFTSSIDIAPGRSRVSAILFAKEPQVMFDFDKYYTNRAVKAAIQRLPYLGGPTFLAKALSFAAGFLWQEQNMKEVRHKHRFMPTPRHDRLQVMILVSDGVSDDDFDRQATHLHEKMLVKIGAVVTKSFNKEKLRPITRFDGAIFLLSEKEALSIWLWNSQKMWNENFGSYVEREKSFHAAEKSFNLNSNRNNIEENNGTLMNTLNQELISQRNSPKKQQKNKEGVKNNNVEQNSKTVVNEDSV